MLIRGGRRQHLQLSSAAFCADSVLQSFRSALPRKKAEQPLPLQVFFVAQHHLCFVSFYSSLLCDDAPNRRRQVSRTYASPACVLSAWTRGHNSNDSSVRFSGLFFGDCVWFGNVPVLRTLVFQFPTASWILQALSPHSPFRSYEE